MKKHWKNPPGCIAHTAVPQPEIDFHREVVSKSSNIPTELSTIDAIISKSQNIDEFYELLKVFMTRDNIKKIEVLTRGQNLNEKWFLFRKRVITASKCHDVLTKMRKIEKHLNSYFDMSSLNFRVSGLTYTNPDIPALKYDRTMEVNAVNDFYEIMKEKHANFQLHECGLYLDETVPFIGASPG